MASLPVIDVSADAAPVQLDGAFRSIGFCYLCGTGVETDPVFDASRRFHALPAASRG